MKLSISNLSWGNTDIEIIAPRLKKIGMHGIEIAPTAIWDDINEVTVEMASNYAKLIESNGMKISGIQSLLFGHPEFQLFDKSSWPAMQLHMHKLIEIGGQLGADIAVFGSPKNRIKNSLDIEEANDIAVDFFTNLIPHLENANLTLTLEPNAPQYGADFLTRYQDTIDIVKRINSSWIKTQIDTGCAIMVDDNPTELFRLYEPAHIHLSTPNLAPVPADSNFHPFLAEALRSNYREWLVIEMLCGLDKNGSEALNSAKWLVNEIKGLKHHN